MNTRNTTNSQSDGDVDALVSRSRYSHLVKTLKSIDDSDERVKRNAKNGIGNVTGKRFNFYNPDLDISPKENDEK